MEILQGCSQAMDAARKKSSADAFSQSGYDLGKLRDRVREEIQAQSAEVMGGIIKKLEKNTPLSPEEKSYVRLWVVGDAEGYVKMEQALNDWLAEYQRLSEVIRDYAGRPESLRDLVDLHGVLEDAAQVANKVAHFLEGKERIQRFDAAINNLDAEHSKLIADILREKLSSPEM